MEDTEKAEVLGTIGEHIAKAIPPACDFVFLLALPIEDDGKFQIAAVSTLLDSERVFRFVEAWLAANAPLRSD